MSKIEKQMPLKLIESDFVAKIKKLDEGLSTGKMWMNKSCETQNKNSRLIRWIKCILSIILPIDLFSSIKVNKVSLNYFEFVEKNKEYLKNQDILENVKNVLILLDKNTKKKYFKEIRVHLIAIDGLVPAKEQNIPVEKDIKQPIVQDTEEVQDQKPLSQESAQLTKENNAKVAEFTQDETPKKLEPVLGKAEEILAENQVQELDLPIEKKITTINAKQVEAIAKKIIANVMSQLKIDVSYKALAGETYPDTSGKQHQVYWNQYDPSSKFMKTLLPIVIREITDSFSTPANFLEKGLDFIFMDCDKEFSFRQGLLTQITDENFELVSQGMKRLIEMLKVNSLEYKITLRVNKERTEEYSKLDFDIHTLYNGAQMGHTGGDLKDFERSATKLMV